MLITKVEQIQMGMVVWHASREFHCCQRRMVASNVYPSRYTNSPFFHYNPEGLHANLYGDYEESCQDCGIGANYNDWRLFTTEEEALQHSGLTEVS